jgi:hypothetical protein
VSALLRGLLTRRPAIKRSAATLELRQAGLQSSILVWLGVAATSVALSGLASAESDAVLVYIYSPSCGACQQFDREVGPIYPKTTEAQTLPMQKIQFDAWRDGTAPFAHCAVSPVLGTPTFIQMRGCEELDRVTGYSDQELFWLALRRMLNRLDAT